MFFKFGKTKKKEEDKKIEDKNALFKKFNEIKNNLSDEKSIVKEIKPEPKEKISKTKKDSLVKESDIEELKVITSPISNEPIDIQTIEEKDIEEKSSEIEISTNNVSEIETTEEKSDISEETIVEEVVLSEEEQNKPIYILGDNPLAWFLAIKLKSNGEKVMIITDGNSMVKENNMTLVENHNLQKTSYKLDTTFWLKETPKLLIITSDARKLNASLTTLSKNKLQNVPIVLFTPIIDTKYIEELLGGKIYKAHFDGYLFEKINQINLYGRNASIYFKTDKNKKSKIIFNLLQKTNITVLNHSNEQEIFWKIFGIHAICSIISAVENKTMFDIIKDKTLRDKSILVIKEFCEVVQKNGININYDETLKKIYSTPLGYAHPLQTALSKGQYGDINIISSNLEDLISKSKIKTQHISNALKKIYRILSK